MISFDEFTLANGLRVLVHADMSVQTAVVNVLYDVGSRDEQPDKTGFAHLFEHLMFGGSKHIPQYDEPLQRVGGENNAFTSTDITNYYLTVPAANLETGFWLESDRMLSLSFDPRVLEIQRKVVIEEFKQRYLNQPYGDVWLKLRPLAYHTHPYQWATIGKDITHIERATLDDVRSFFFTHYVPNNAVLVVAGHVTTRQVQALAEKWFGPIARGADRQRQLPAEPRQTERRTTTVEARVPAHALYKAWHMPGRFSPDFYAADLLADILGRGESSRLHHALVEEREMFTSIAAYTTSTIDPGLLVVSGRLQPGVALEEAEEAVEQVLEEVRQHVIPAGEVEKVKNQAEAALAFDEVDVLNRAMNLAFAKLSGDAQLVNEETARIRSVKAEDIQRLAAEVLRESNGSTLRYQAVG